MVTREEADQILKEKFGIEVEKDIKYQFMELTTGKNKDWGEASELLVKYILDRLKIYTTKDDLKTEMWVYKEGIYVPQGKSEVRELMRGILEEQFSTFIYNMVISKIEPDTFIDIDDFFKSNYVEEIPVQNGILNVRTMELSNFTPDKIFFNKIPVKFELGVSCPKIDQFLKDVLSHEEDIKVIYEWAGFCLLKEYTYEKGLMLVGDGRNGKGKTIELIKRLIGAENCCSIPLTSVVPESFSISELYGKLLNWAGDISNKDLKDTSMFKSCTGRDLIGGKRKFLRNIYFENFAKFTFACNELPMVYDTSRGFWERWLLLEFPYTFITEEDYNKLEDKNGFKIKDDSILDKIISPQEMTGFLNMALEGLARLRRNKGFSCTLGSQQIKDLWIRRSNSVMAFCVDAVVGDYESYIGKKEFRKRYSEYCKLHQIPSKSDYVIKRTIEEMFGATEEHKEGLGGIWERCWGGIRWK